MQYNQTSPESADTLNLLLLCAGSGVGGMEQTVRRLASELIQQRASVQVILPECEDARQTATLFQGDGIPTECHSSLTHAFGKRRLKGVLPLARKLCASSASVVNFHYGMNFPPLNDILASRSAGKQCVVSLHSGGGADPLPPWERRLKNRIAATFCTAIIAVSEYQAGEMVQHGIPPQKIKVIPNGVTPVLETPDPRKNARERLGLPIDAFIVCVVARLTVPKNVSALISVLAEQSEIPFYLAIAGDGPERAILEAEANIRLPGRHRFFGNLQDITALYEASDIFALPSREESFGLVFAEAAHFGLPCVAFSVGGVPETIHHGLTGLLTPLDDLRSFGIALRCLYFDDSLRKRYGTEARLRAQSIFTTQLMTERYLRVYRGAKPGYHGIHRRNATPKNA